MDKGKAKRKQFLQHPGIKIWVDASVEGIYELSEWLFKGKPHGLLLCATFLFEISEQLARLAQAAVIAHDVEEEHLKQQETEAGEVAREVIAKAKQP